MILMIPCIACKHRQRFTETLYLNLPKSDQFIELPVLKKGSNANYITIASNLSKTLY